MARKWSRKKAIRELVRTRQLSTAMLAPLGISFESFLRFAQLPKERADEITEKLIAKLEVEL